jgi:hemerythrin-like metal-binding protein
MAVPDKENAMDHYFLPDSTALSCPDLQAEHETLVGILNQALDIIRSEQNPDIEPLLALLEKLRKAAVAHFAHEEEIMANLGYADLASHSIHHAHCIVRLSQIGDTLLAGKIKPGRNLLDELFDMILDDVIRADSGFKSFLDNKNPGFR